LGLCQVPPDFDLAAFLGDGLLVAARRGPEPLTLALVNVDHFKRVNDTHGHGSGDAVQNVQRRGGVGNQRAARGDIGGL
jgi:PleD family two-component response regulator